MGTTFVAYCLTLTVSNIDDIDTVLAVTDLHASKPGQDFTCPYRAVLSNRYSVASFATHRVLSRLYLRGLL
jgi:hypothetical protein